MPIKVPVSTFEPATEGLHQVVCVDVVADRKETQYGMRDVVKIVWQTEGINPKNGKPYIVSQTFGATWSPKGNLRKTLRSWRGRDFRPEELEDFDLETLIGANAQMNVIHETKEGVTYANIAAIMPLPRGVSKIAPRDYKRQIERDRQQPRELEASDIVDATADDDIPF